MKTQTVKFNLPGSQISASAGTSLPKFGVFHLNKMVACSNCSVNVQSQILVVCSVMIALLYIFSDLLQVQLRIKLWNTYC